MKQTANSHVPTKVAKFSLRNSHWLVSLAPRVGSTAVFFHRGGRIDRGAREFHFFPAGSKDPVIVGIPLMFSSKRMTPAQLWATFSADPCALGLMPGEGYEEFIDMLCGQYGAGERAVMDEEFDFVVMEVAQAELMGINKQYLLQTRNNCSRVYDYV